MLCRLERRALRDADRIVGGPRERGVSLQGRTWILLPGRLRWFVRGCTEKVSDGFEMRVGKIEMGIGRWEAYLRRQLKRCHICPFPLRPIYEFSFDLADSSKIHEYVLLIKDNRKDWWWYWDEWKILPIYNSDFARICCLRIWGDLQVWQYSYCFWVSQQQKTCLWSFTWDEQILVINGEARSCFQIKEL